MNDPKISSPQLSVVVPLYNEVESVERLWEAIHPVMEGLGGKALVLGMFLGWLPADVGGVFVLVFAALMLGSLLGVVMGLAVGLLRVRTRRELLPDPDLEEGELLALPWNKQPFPFGPSLSIASIAAVLLSNQLL